MDLSALSGQSEKVMAVIESIKNEPNLLSELIENPQETLSKPGIELNEEELGLVQKLGSMTELEGEAEGIFGKVKGLFGFKESS